MENRGGEFSFFQSIHVKIDMRIDISISVRLMTTKFGKQATSSPAHLFAAIKGRRKRDPGTLYTND